MIEDATAKKFKYSPEDGDVCHVFDGPRGKTLVVLNVDRKPRFYPIRWKGDFYELRDGKRPEMGRLQPAAHADAP